MRYQYLKASVTPEFRKKVTEWSENVGIAQGQFCGLIMQLGLQAFIRVHSPEKLLSEDDWKKLNEMMGQKDEREIVWSKKTD